MAQQPFSGDRGWIRALTAVVASLALGAAMSLGGCTSDDGSTPSPSASAAPSATHSAAPTSAGPGASPSPTSVVRPWTSSPLVVTKSISVPPVPRLIGIRSAAHSQEGYDRITFDFDKTLPGYEIRYVDKVIADGSGLPVYVPGRRFLQIIFRPAQAHDDSGNQSVTPRSKTLNYPMMKAYAITGDYEAVLTVVLGLDDVVGFRVGELPGEPGRIYVDVAA